MDKNFTVFANERWKYIEEIFVNRTFNECCRNRQFLLGNLAIGNLENEDSNAVLFLTWGA